MNSIYNSIFKYLNHKVFLIVIILICLYTQGRQSDKYFGWSNPKNTTTEHLATIHSDGSGYYAYLPQWFIYRDSLHFNFIEKISQKYKKNNFISGLYFDYKAKKGIDKYCLGTPICIAPFFLVNHFVNNLAYGNGDGYSKSYQFTVSFAAIFYWLLGIIGLVKLLRAFEISNLIIALMIGIISLGTDLNFYSVYFPSFSHVYSFCAITWFLYYGKMWGMTNHPKFLLRLGFLLGLIFIIRPTNSLIVLFIPFFFNSWKHFIDEILTLFKNNKKSIFYSTLVLFFLIFSQLYSTYNQIGKWTFNTYNDEHFDFLLNPKIYEVLFGYRKGFFVYAPIMLLLIPAIFYQFKTNKYLTWGWLIVFILFIYLTSSWWCWWYGGGLGMRPMVDYMSFLILPIALLLKNISYILKVLVFAFSVIMIYFYQILQIQFNLNIIHYDNMSAENYWDIFLKTDKRFSWMLHFKEYTIKKETIKRSQKFYLNTSNFLWSKKMPTENEYVLKYEDADPQYFFHPELSWNTSKIGVRLAGKMMLHNPESNPSFSISLYKKGILVKNEEIYVGHRIEEIDEFSTFSADYIGDYKYSMIDSIGVTLHKGIPNTEIKNMSYTFYFLKN